MKTRGLYPGRPKTKLREPMREVVHDPYASKCKLADPSVCSQCGAVYMAGRWSWQKEVPSDMTEVVCPGCHRVNDKYPAGQVTLSGEFMKRHAQEILNMLHHEAGLENSEHPLNRILAIKEEADRTIVTTTDIHLPRRFVHALERSFKGQSEIQFDEEGYFARATWHRDE